MAGGINITPQVGAELAITGTISVVGSILARGDDITSTPQPFRPPQWNRPATTSITVPASRTGSPIVSVNAAGVATTTTGTTAASVFVFDGILRIGHSQTARPTRHPIQTGANVTDHIVLDPARLLLEVYMSDAMDSFATGMWTGNSSKSVAAFQAMQKVQASRQLVTVSTRLRTYTSMAIIDVQAPDTNATAHGLRMLLSLEQIFMVSVATVQMSARPNATETTVLGTKQATNPTAAAVANNQLPSPIYPAVTVPKLQAAEGSTVGAGTWSSNPTSLLPGGQP